VGDLLVKPIGRPARLWRGLSDHGGPEELHFIRSLFHRHAGCAKPPFGVRQSAVAVSGRVDEGFGDGPGGHDGLPDEWTR
jgi:hypothetical protein